jgi:hypothetical protein
MPKVKGDKPTRESVLIEVPLADANDQRVVNVSGALRYLLEPIGSGQTQLPASAAKYSVTGR